MSTAQKRTPASAEFPTDKAPDRELLIGPALAGRAALQTGIGEVFEAQIARQWTRRFGRLILTQAPSLSRGTVLDVACHAGQPGLAFLRRNPGTRLVAIDPSDELLGLARQAGRDVLGKRAFFRAEPAGQRLPFDEDVFDLVLSNLGLYEHPAPAQLYRELVRVAKPGAEILVSVPLAGTFDEVLDVLTALAADQPEAAQRLAAHRSAYPTPDTLFSWAAALGLENPVLQVEPFSLLFAGGSDLIAAPLLRYGPLPAWHTVLGDGTDDRSELLQAAWAAMDGGARLHASTAQSGEFLLEPPSSAQPPSTAPLQLTVRAACFRARKPILTDDSRSPEGTSTAGEAATRIQVGAY